MARTQAARFAPDLSELMAEQEAFWKGDPVSDRAREQFHALVALAAAARPVTRAMNLLVAPSFQQLERLRMADLRLERAVQSRRRRG